MYNQNRNTHYCHGHSPMGGFMSFEDLKPLISQYQKWMPYDLTETRDHYEVVVPLPGFDVNEIEVSVKGDSIMIEATPEINEPESEDPQQNESESSEKDEYPHHIVSMANLIWNRPIKIKIPVEKEIDPEKVKAKLNRGLLKIRFNKKPAKKIEVEEF